MSELSDFLRSEGYEVTPDGVVYSTIAKHPRKIGQTLNQHHDPDGYLQVSLTSQYGRKSFKVHALVAEYHLPPRPSPFHEVRHKDGSRDNNHVDNLEWGTKAENCLDRSFHQARKRGFKCPKGHDLLVDGKFRAGKCVECVNENARRSYARVKARMNSLSSGGPNG